MNETRRVCDCCKTDAGKGGTFLRVEHGTLRTGHGVETLDLCEGCSGRLAEFLKNGQAAAKPAAQAQVAAAAAPAKA